MKIYCIGELCLCIDLGTTMTQTTQLKAHIFIMKICFRIKIFKCLILRLDIWYIPFNSNCISMSLLKLLFVMTTDSYNLEQNYDFSTLIFCLNEWFVLDFHVLRYNLYFPSICIIALPTVIFLCVYIENIQIHSIN